MMGRLFKLLLVWCLFLERTSGDYYGGLYYDETDSMCE